MRLSAPTLLHLVFPPHPTVFPPAHPIPPLPVQHLIDSKFMSLGQAAILLGIKLSLSTFDPSAPSPAAAGVAPEALTRAQADAALTSDMVRSQRALHLAEVAHRVNEDCLPRMRSENARLAANALASLYHLSVAEVGFCGVGWAGMGTAHQGVQVWGGFLHSLQVVSSSHLRREAGGWVGFGPFKSAFTGSTVPGQGLELALLSCML